MKKVIFLAMLFTGYSFGMSGQEGKEFNYDEIIAIAAIKDNKNCLFAGFPTFITMRSIISDAENRFEPIVDAPSVFIYELFLVDENSASATVFLGNHWLSDGNQISKISDADFSFLTRTISARKFENENSRLESLTKDVNVATLKNELLKTQDYESIGRHPNNTNANIKSKKITPDLNTKPINEKTEIFRHSSTSKSSTSQTPLIQQTPQMQASTLNLVTTETNEKPNTKESKRDETFYIKEKIPKLAFLIGLVIMFLFWRWMRIK